GCLFLFLDVEELIQLRNFKNFVDLRVNIAQDQTTARGVHFFIQRNEFAKSRTRKIFHVAEVQEEFTAAQIVHQAEKLLANDLDVLVVEYFLVGEIDNRHLSDIFDFQAPPSGLRRHIHSSSDDIQVPAC